MLIEDCYLQTGDDAVAIKSGWDCFGETVAAPAANITVRNVTVHMTHNNNAAGFTVGSEMSPARASAAAKRAGARCNPDRMELLG